jgi:PRC-barrel domain
MIRTLTLATALAAAITLPAIAQDVKAPVASMNTASASLSLTSQEARAWIGKPVYSSDGTKLGEIATFELAAGNKVNGMDANIGGFLGLGEHRIRLSPAHFSLKSDRVVLNLTAAQAKELPKVSN